jgi:hypothetical protein
MTEQELKAKINEMITFMIANIGAITAINNCSVHDVCDAVELLSLLTGEDE